jgi:hypothetical protein
MLEINKTSKYIQLEYIYGDYNPSPEDWVIDKLNSEGEIGISNNAFTLTTEFLVDKTRLKFSEPESISEVRPNIVFNIAELKTYTFENKIDEYYEFYNEVLVRGRKILFHKDIEIDISLFIAEKNISIFKQIAALVEGDVIIGGISSNSIPLEEFYILIKNFPTTHEKKLYAQSRISSVLKNYFENVKDAERSYTKYRNKKHSKKGIELVKMFEEYEVDKYQTIYDKLSLMLDDEENYNETTWQKEIIDILLLLYPKYITVFREVPISADDVKQKYLDYLFVDANGHVDIVEIKKPFEQAIMTKNKYRDNFIPLRELSGTVMQIEKYIYFLNRWAKTGEKKLTEKYKEDLPKGFEIHITNPKGFIIMGRENNLSKSQKNDFEVVKRKYKNVIDILSYDDLLNRLKFSIEQIKRH